MALSSAALRLKMLMEDLPLPDERLQEAESLIKDCTEMELSALGLGPPPRPSVPRGLLHDAGKDVKAVSPQQRLHAVQHVINSLQYNHTPGYYYNVSKSRPYSRIMDTAREALRAALPIKCLEAVFLGALLTAGWTELDRLPLAFKSTVQGQTYRHIVLVVFHTPSRKWGALGLSRRPELMDKDLVYDSLADLVSDYKASYERWWHTLARVYVGLPLEHDTYYAGPVCWRYLTLSLTGRKSWTTHRASLDKFAAQARRLAAKFRAMGGNPASNNSLGGPDTSQQQQPAQQTSLQGGSGAAACLGGSAHNDRSSGPGDKNGSGSRTTGTPPGPGTASATATAMRCAKSVSPARRRPPAAAAPPLPPPAPRRPITPSRAHGGPAGSNSSSGVTPGTTRTPSTPAATTSAVKKEAPPDGKPGVKAADASAAIGGHSGGGGGGRGGGGGGASPDILTPGRDADGGGAAAALGPHAHVAGGAPGAGIADGGVGGGTCTPAGADAGGVGMLPIQQPVRAAAQGTVAGGGGSRCRESRRNRRRARRSSDPGNAASLAATAESLRVSARDARAQARKLRQEARAEDEEDVEEESEESSEGEYISEGSDVGDSDDAGN